VPGRAMEREEVPDLSPEDRTVVDEVASLLQTVQRWRSEGEVDDRAGSVVLRKLLTDGGSGHFTRAWRLLGFTKEPVIP
jgi:hypothetical protein